MKSSQLFLLVADVLAVWLFCCPARCEDRQKPLTTAAEAAKHIGQTATVEFTVAAVKHSQRRKAVLLNSTANARSPENISAMIDEAELGNFDATTEEDLARRLVGRRIRIHGRISRDEDQLVVRLLSNEQMTVVEPAAVASQAGEIVLVDEDGQQRLITAKELSKLAKAVITIDHHGAKETFSGVSLASVLKHAGIALGQEARGRNLSRYLLLTASDGYQALLSVGEVDPHLRKQTVLLADECDGRPLGPTEGPWRLIIPDDTRRRRWVRSVVRIDVRYADVAKVTARN